MDFIFSGAVEISVIEVWEREHGLKIAFGGILTMGVMISIYISFYVIDFIFNKVIEIIN